MVFLNSSTSNLQVTPVFPRLVDLSPEKFQAALARILQVSLDQCWPMFFRNLSNSHPFCCWFFYYSLSFWLLLNLSACLECSQVRTVFQYCLEFVINHSFFFPLKFISALQPLVVTLIVKLSSVCSLRIDECVLPFVGFRTHRSCINSCWSFDRSAWHWPTSRLCSFEEGICRNMYKIALQV